MTSEIVSHLLQNVTGFMKMLLPSYLAVMVFAGNAMSAMSFYELTFFILYGIEVLMIYATAATDQSVCSVLFNKLHDERRSVFKNGRTGTRYFSVGVPNWC